MINRKVNIKIKETEVSIENISNFELNECLLDITNVQSDCVLYKTFDLKIRETKVWNIEVGDKYEKWKDKKLKVRLYSNYKKIFDRYLNDKTNCFVIITNRDFENLSEQLIIGLDKYTDIDILNYTVGYHSQLSFTNLINIEFKDELSKPLIFLDVLNRGYRNAIFLNSDIQVRSNISKLIDYINEIEDVPILQKSGLNRKIQDERYLADSIDYIEMLQNYPQVLTNVLIFNEKQKDLFSQWSVECTKVDRKNEFIDDELILNYLMWKNNINPKYFNMGIGIQNLKDLKFFYNQNLTQSSSLNRDEISFFYSIKDYKLASEVNDYIRQREVEDFEERILSFYDNITKVEKRELINENLQIIDHYIDGAYLEINADPRRNFLVKFLDETGNLRHSSIISGNMWTKTSIRYYVKWRKVIEENGKVIYDQTLNLKNKRVMISLESNSIGDTLAWMPYAEEFRKKHNCEVVLCTFHNYLFKDQYTNITFIEPRETAYNITATYRLGWFYTENFEMDLTRHPKEFRKLPMQQTSSDILGLDYQEIKPIIKTPDIKKDRKVGIAIHATAQSKYWNNTSGWQTVVDYLNGIGYKVILYSKEENGHMGNIHPIGITKFIGGTLQDVINDMYSCEFFIGIGSGLSWLAWSINLPVILISGFSEEYTETVDKTYRVINKNVCNGCFNWDRLDPGDWNWCPKFKGTNQHFECTKSITGEMVIEKINELINDIKNVE